MQKKAKNLLKISAIYLGTVLGAGFASGQELVLFFARFCRRGLLGCLIAGGLFSFLGWLILKKSFLLNEKTHRAYLTEIFGKPVAGFLSFVTEIFLCISFCVMLSGAGAFFTQRLLVSPVWGILITDAICLVVFLYDLKGLSAVNLILSPIMLFGTVGIALYSTWTEAYPTAVIAVNQHALFLPYALFYVGYNMLTATAVLVPASELAEDERSAGLGGAFGGILLTIMAFLCSLALFFSEEVWGSSLPMLLLSERAGRFAYGVYSAVLYMAMLTTAVSTGFSVVRRVSSFGIGEKKGAILLCIFAIPLSFVEFSVLVQSCYVFFGVLGVLLVVGILWDWYKKS